MYSGAAGLAAIVVTAPVLGALPEGLFVRAGACVFVFVVDSAGVRVPVEGLATALVLDGPVVVMAELEVFDGASRCPPVPCGSLCVAVDVWAMVLDAAPGSALAATAV